MTAYQQEPGRLAQTLLVVLALELLTLVAGLGLLWAQGRISAGRWAAIALGWYLGLRAFATLKNFWVTYRHRSTPAPEHQIGAMATLRLLWGEFRTNLLVYSWLFPFERRLVPQAPVAAAPGTGTPIVLVPGFACNRGYWRQFARWLHEAGQGPVYAVSLEPLFGSIDENARRLGEQIEAVCAATGAQKVILIGHSMGGVTIRAYLHGGNAHRIERIITLGSPHHGTVIAHEVRAFGENLRQMSLGSAWAAALNAHEARDCPVPITALITPHDDIVAPQDSACLRHPNARNVFLPGIGHLEMVVSRPVFDATLAALRH